MKLIVAEEYTNKNIQDKENCKVYHQEVEGNTAREKKVSHQEFDLKVVVENSYITTEIVDYTNAILTTI